MYIHLTPMINMISDDDSTGWRNTLKFNKYCAMTKKRSIHQLMNPPSPPSTAKVIF